jgi:hypothetical protein
MGEEAAFQEAIAKVERNEAIARKYLEDHAHHYAPVSDLPLAHKVIPPRNLHPAEPGEAKCGAKARLEQDNPFGKVRAPCPASL